MDIRTSEELSFEQPTNQEMWGECLLGIYKSLEVISGQLEALLHARQTNPDLLTDLDQRAINGITSSGSSKTVLVTEGV